MTSRTCYGFPAVVLGPGKECTVEAKVGGLFRADKLSMVATMAEIRGHYNIKRSRLGLLNRDFVTAYSRIHKWSNGRVTKFRPGRTVIEFLRIGISNRDLGLMREFYTRDYQPKSVQYFDTNALEYIMLTNLFIGAEPQMPNFGGAPALWVTQTGHIPLPSTDLSVSLQLKNIGDVVVKVHAMMLGRTAGNGGIVL